MAQFNPYQPPAHADELLTTVVSAPGEPLPWDTETALSVGWDRVKRWWPVLVLAPVLVNCISWTNTYVFTELGLQGVDSLVGLVIDSFFGVGLVRMFLSAVRGQPPQFGQLFGGGDRMLAMLGTQLLMGLAIVAGMILLVVPGIIVALGLSLSFYCCVDQNLGPVESLKASWAMMRGCKGQMFGFGFIVLFVLIAGLLALVVGVFVASSVIYAAAAWIYTRRRGEHVPVRLD